MSSAGPYSGAPLPPPAPGWTPPPAARPVDRVRGPAIGMMAAAGLIALYLLGMGGLYGIAMIAGSMQQPGGTPPDMTSTVVGGTMVAVIALLAFAIAGFIAFGALKMMRLESYPLALAATIATFVAGVPCSCCPINTAIAWPIAIWSLIVLSDAAVKAAFAGPDTSAFD